MKLNYSSAKTSAAVNELNLFVAVLENFSPEPEPGGLKSVSVAAVSPAVMDFCIKALSQTPEVKLKLIEVEADDAEVFVLSLLFLVIFSSPLNYEVFSVQS